MPNRNARRTSDPRKRFVIAIVTASTRNPDGSRKLDGEGQQITPAASDYVPVDGLEAIRCSRIVTNGDYDKQPGVGQVMPHETQVFQCRKLENVSVGYAVRFNGQILQISRIAPVENPVEGRLDEMLIFCMGTPR